MVFSDNARGPPVGRHRRYARAMIYSFGEFGIDSAGFTLTRAGRAVAVEPQVLELLIFLIERRDQVVSRDELLGTVWKGRVVSDTTLSSRIKSARKAIGDDGSRQQYIKTIHGRGFRFIGGVETPDRTQAATPTAERSSSAERPTTHYARSGSIHIAYQVFGEGSTNLVLTPGFVSHIDNYWDSPALARWLQRLGGQAQVAMFDKRGTGMSDQVHSLPGMDERMDDVRAVMDAAGFDSAFILGISEGGSLAALFAAHHPERCDGLILHGSFPKFAHWFPDEASLQALFDYIERDWGSGKSLPQFAPSMTNDRSFQSWWGRFERLGATPGAAISLMRMNSQIDISDVLPSIQVPTLVIHRAEDVLIDVQGGRYLAEHIPGAEYLELPGNDHLPWVGGDQDRIMQAIETLLSDATVARLSTRAVATILLIRFSGKSADADIEATRSALERELGRFRGTGVALQSLNATASFDGPARALQCAVSTSRLLRHNDIQHCIGIHTGEIDIAADPLEGTAIKVAVNVANYARDQEIWVSRTVNDLVAGSDVALEDRGEFHLEAIDRVWRLFSVTE